MRLEDLEQTDKPTNSSFRDLQNINNGVFTRLTVLKYAGRKMYSVGKGYSHFWLCKCECGNEIITLGYPVLIGKTKSCGCYSKSVHTTHDMSKTPEYYCWRTIIKRCYSDKHHKYKNYGGRGIKVCDLWLTSFIDFLVDMGKRPSDKHSIDRIEVNGDYCFENCRWATDEEQRNNKTNSRYITIDGETLTIAQWGRRLGIIPQTILSRLRKGMSEREALTTPVKKRSTK